MTISPPINSQNIWKSLETIPLSSAFVEHLDADFFRHINIPSLPACLPTLSGRAIDLQRSLRLVENGKKFEASWKGMKVILGATLVAMVAITLFAVSRLDFSKLSTKSILKYSVKAILIGGLAWMGYKGIASLKEDEIEPFKNFVHYLERKFPAISGILGASKVAEIEINTRKNEQSLCEDITICRTYFREYFAEINDVLSKEIGNYLLSPVKASKQFKSELSTVQSELVKINLLLTSLSIPASLKVGSLDEDKKV